jgi:asparagine synthase (glutamine-hydrolysing)
VAEAIPFDALTKGSLERLYALKGEIVAAGVKAVTGLAMPAYPKRRFQHGATSLVTLRAHLPERESDYRRRFLSLYDR